MANKIKEIKKSDAPAINKLFRAVYPEKWIDLQYFPWLIESPLGFVGYGAWTDKNELVAFYCAVGFHNFVMVAPVCYSAMTHPDFRRRGLIQTIANCVYDDLNADYCFLFANENIKDLYEFRLGFVNGGQITQQELEFDICDPYTPLKLLPDHDLRFNVFYHWRFTMRPDVGYWFFKTSNNFVICSKFEDSIQVVDFHHWDEWTLEVSKSLALHFMLTKITLWSEEILEGFTQVQVSTWIMFKPLRDGVDIDEIIKNHVLRMAQSDVF